MDMRFLSEKEALQGFIADLEKQGNAPKKWNLDRVRHFALCLEIPLVGNFICVAGTNGKGSTCAMLEAGFRSLGLRTGLYTSPHLISWNERICIDGEPIGDGDFARLLARILPVAHACGKGADGPLSAFEILTIGAFFYFLQKSVSIAIIEVGLGGRLDATNIATPRVSCITTVGLDHEDILGETIGEIAIEKAGIIKNNIPVVLGEMPAEARTAIEAIARERHAPVLSAIPSDNGGRTLRHLNGREQEKNWPVAAAAGEMYIRSVLGSGKCDVDRFLDGAANARWRGRWERRTIGGRTWIFDCTHNGCGLPFLRANWEDEQRKNHWGRPTIVTAMLGVRRARALLPFLASIGNRIIFVELDEPRALSRGELAAIIAHIPSIPIRMISQSDLHSIHFGDREGPILVTGSIYLVGKMFKALGI
ncbi:MAG: hypothetical protein LBI69_01645 [Puniceicoccales bacterium]|jgi:dihydrofolate synthase/folylpolyglutamate synthase|nr:hypothetical protein [Puniceicoccales bacterium]